MTHKVKKSILISVGVLFSFVFLVVLFVSPITKFLVEKYDTKFIGREIKMDWAYVNPFTGYIYFSKVRISELDADSSFISIDNLMANFALWKLFKGTYEINEITLNRPKANIIQNKKALNFDDLIKLFQPKSHTSKRKSPIHFNVLNIQINNGEFHYYEQHIQIHYFIKNVNITSSGKWWNKDSLEATFSFTAGIGSGNAKGDCSINLENLNYRLHASIAKYDLDFVQQYLKDISNYGSFRANLDAEIKARGNFKDQENISARGQLSFNDFHFGKNPKEDYASFDKLILAINELSPKHHKYLFDSIAITHPFFLYERYDKLDNVQTMFGKKGSKITEAAADKTEFNLVIEIARYVKVLAKNFFRSNYKINRLVVYKGDLRFNDYSTSEKFAIGLSPINAFADSIDKNHKRVSVVLVSGIKPFGNGSVTLSINPKDSSDFELEYQFEKLPATLFNPYLISYTSFPLDRGTLELKGKWTVRNGEINSNNHLTVIDPRISSRLLNKGTQWIPMRVIMALVRERGNVIDYEIPITGNLTKPNFHLRDVIFDVATNIFVKPATTPYRIQVRNIEKEIEKSLAFNWEMITSKMNSNQLHFLQRLAEFLKDNPDASLSITPQNYTLKEKEYLLLYEAKKKYYRSKIATNTKTYTETDSNMVAKMSIKDPQFVNYLNHQIKDSLLFTIQDKCAGFVSVVELDQYYAQLQETRKKAFLSVFSSIGVSSQINFMSGKTVIPYNGFSFYQIDYTSEFPESLLKAYRELNVLNNASPRKKFKWIRKKNQHTPFINNKIKKAVPTN
ncbi:MAG: DUF748 domain-containing protein [Bacteroidetes bacterium]|nr:DUF748 domain-containing protein [Bacteroidota bacterium]MBK9800543.1 DUF748 domain-containing protein [Bacteroidota bacterium]MBP6412122.1 DUF748 domain-containing protein [Bacteroidia bacterium]